jgi:hypothetical protein
MQSPARRQIRLKIVNIRLRTITYAARTPFAAPPFGEPATAVLENPAHLA